MPKLMKIDLRGGLLRRLGCFRDQKGDDDVPVGGFAGADRFDQKVERSVGFDNEFTGSPHREVGVLVKLAVLHVLADRLLDLGLGQEGARVDFLGPPDPCCWTEATPANKRKTERAIVDLRIMRINSNIWNLLINELISSHRRRRPSKQA